MRFSNIGRSMLLAASLLATSTASFAASDVYLPVVSKGFMHEFWQTVKMGSDAAAKELGIKTDFVGPSDENSN